MSAVEDRRPLLWALALLALGGLMLHYRVHPFLAPDPSAAGRTIFRGSFLAATLLPAFDLAVVTALFSFRRTAPLAHLLNGVLVVYGTVLMGHYSIAMLADKGLAPVDWLLRSTAPDIALAWADFLVGKTLYDSWMREA